MRIKAFILLSLMSLGLLAGEPSKTIFIDVAHGGKDSGAQIEGVSEKDLCLALALKVQELAKKSSMEVILVRSDDRFVSLQERAQQINASEAELFISLHFGVKSSDSPGGLSFHYSEEQSELDQSLSLIQSLEKSLATLFPESQRVAGSFFLLKEAQIPGVLVEFANLNSPEELQYWTSEENQWQVAAAILEGI